MMAKLVSAALAATLLAPPAYAQLQPGPNQELDDQLGKISKTGERADKEQEGSKRDLLIVPIPQMNPSLGGGAILTASLFYNPNHSSEPWVTGVGYMRTTNDSWILGGLHKMTLDHDRHRIGVFAGYGNVNVEFYGVGARAGERDLSLGLNERGFAGLFQAQTRIRKNLYAGVRLLHLRLTSRIRRDNPLFPDAEIPSAELRTRLTEVGPAISYDNRDSGLDPRQGELINAFWLFGIEALGGDFTHNKLTMNANIYRPIAKNTVFAGRLSVCSASNGGPFYDLCLYGSSSDLRGYEAGQYRDQAYWAGQFEIRQHLFWRFGAVVFAGVGESARSLKDFGSGKFLPAAGIGVRLQPSKDTPINLRVDYARGRDSKGVYISIGEAF